MNEKKLFHLFCTVCNELPVTSGKYSAIFSRFILHKFQSINKNNKEQIYYLRSSRFFSNFSFNFSHRCPFVCQNPDR